MTEKRKTWSPEHRANIAASVTAYYENNPEAREHQRRTMKAKWDPSTPEGARLRAQDSARVRAQAAKAKQDAIDAEIAQRILRGELFSTESPEGGAVDA